MYYPKSSTTNSAVPTSHAKASSRFSAPLPEDLPLVTSNLKIFPSLHPLSAIYRQKDSNTNISERQDDYYPSKKIFCADGTQKLTTSLQNVINPTKPIIKQFNPEKPRYEVSGGMPKTPFDIPRLPKRNDMVESRKTANVYTQEDMGSKISINLELASEPLTVPENIQIHPRRDQFFLENYKSQKYVKNQEISPVKKAPKFDIFNLMAKPQPQTYNSIYKNLQLDYYALEMKKRLIEIEQEKIAQTLQDLKRTEFDSCNPDAEIQRNDSVETSADSVKEEYMH